MLELNNYYIKDLENLTIDSEKSFFSLLKRRYKCIKNLQIEQNLY